MNNIINKLVLAGDMFMPKMHLKQPEFTCSTCGPFTKNKAKTTKILRNRRLQIYLFK